jgi:hypothetical protein
MNRNICPHCGFDDYEIIDDQPEFRIHVCHACNETYEVNRTAEEIEEIEAELLDEQAIDIAGQHGFTVGLQRRCSDGRVYEIKRIYWSKTLNRPILAILDHTNEVCVYTIDDMNPSRAYWECGYVDVPAKEAISP